jgi:hypothetical protein
MTALVQYAIYYHPKDHPDNFVVRRWVVANNRRSETRWCAARTLMEARESIPGGLIRVDWLDAHDPVILEVWV